MNKKTALAVLSVFVVWSLLDFLIHGCWLCSTYQATQSLWRPEAEMMQGLMIAVTFLHALAFTMLYATLVGTKTVRSGVDYGMWWGLAGGITMGIGSYCYMPIPLELALSWFLGALANGIIGGFVLGRVFKA